jgi:hypothetical protein
MSRSSSLGAVSALIITGSNAIPQIGHEPGPGCRISGCIGQVYSATAPTGGAGTCAVPPSCPVWMCPVWSCPVWSGSPVC